MSRADGVVIACVLLFMGLAGCGTPKDVRDYAKTSAAQMTTMSDNVGGLGTREKGVLDVRRRTAESMFLAGQDADADYAKAVALMNKAARGNGESCGQARAPSFVAVVINRYQQQQQAADDRAVARQNFNAGLDQKIKPFTEAQAAQVQALSAAAQSAGSLSEEMTQKELAAFLFEYFKQVKTSFDEGQKQKTQSAAAETKSSAADAGAANP